MKYIKTSDSNAKIETNYMYIKIYSLDRVS
jgi:hypothetical protein